MTDITNPDELLTTAQAAEILGLKVRMVQRLCQNKIIKAMRAGERLFLIRRADLEEYMKTRPKYNRK